ncbi:MAG: PriCT-2 domain-containing protein [Magnetococcales bacterium]|nr:PriCT-2 domain-containing protein [Magnetococcales bacterium]
MAALDPGCDREKWFTVGAALKNRLGDQEGFHLFDHWSRGGASYNLAPWRNKRDDGRLDQSSPIGRKHGACSTYRKVGGNGMTSILSSRVKKLEQGGRWQSQHG